MLQHNIPLKFAHLTLHAFVVAEAPLTCKELSPPDNGEISVAPGPNSLSHGLGS